MSGGLSILKDLGWYSPPSPIQTDSPGPLESSTPAASSYSGGWGPERTVYSWEAPASYAVLNSIGDNPVQGDERNFVRARLVDAGNETYADRLVVSPGDVVVVNAYVGNDAADDLGLAATILGLNAQVVFGAPGNACPVGVILGGTNVKDVWDGATLLSDVPIALRYVPDSAFFHTNATGYEIDGDYGNQSPMVLGQYQQDGEYPIGYSSDGVYQGTGYLTFRVEVERR